MATGQWGIRRVGKRAGTVGYLNKKEAKAKPYEYGLGTIFAASKREADQKVSKIMNLKQKYPDISLGEAQKLVDRMMG